MPQTVETPPSTLPAPGMKEKLSFSISLEADSKLAPNTTCRKPQLILFFTEGAGKRQDGDGSSKKQELRGNSVWPQSPSDGWWGDEGQEAQPWWIRQRFRDLPKADVSEKLLLPIMNPDCPHKWFGTEPFSWPLLALPSWNGDSETSLFPYFDLLQRV